MKNWYYFIVGSTRILAVFGGLLIVFLSFVSYTNLEKAKDSAWRLGCMDGGLSNEQCVKLQKELGK